MYVEERSPRASTYVRLSGVRSGLIYSFSLRFMIPYAELTMAVSLVFITHLHFSRVFHTYTRPPHSYFKCMCMRARDLTGLNVCMFVCAWSIWAFLCTMSGTRQGCDLTKGNFLFIFRSLSLLIIIISQLGVQY